MAVALLIATFVGLLLYFAPPRVIFSDRPITVIDHSLHFYQIDRAVKAFFGWGKLWSYDPQMLAGQPAGVVEDLTSKGTELFVIALVRLGLSPGLAYNVFVLTVHLAMPLVGWAAARLFRLDRVQAIVAVLLWVLLWFFDSFLHWCWAIGMISWSADCYLAVLYVALLYRYFDESRPWHWPALLLLGATLSIVHPFGALSVLGPALAMYAREFRRLPASGHAKVWALGLGAAATALVWVGPALRFRHYILDADTYLRPTLEYVVLDFLDLVKDWFNTGTPVRTMIRTLCFACAGVVIWRWQKAGDKRALPLSFLLVITLLFAYVSGYSWYGRQTQPYRQIGVATFASAIPAAVLLTELLAPKTLKALPRSAHVLLLLALVLIVPRAGRTVLMYFPALQPEPDRFTADSFSPMVGFEFEPKPLAMRHEGPSDRYLQLREWLQKNAPAKRGRIVIYDWILAEYLAATTDLALLGGLPERNVPHVDSHPQHQGQHGYAEGKALEGYLERYAVGWIVVEGDFGPLDYRRDVLSPSAKVADYRIYRSRLTPHYFVRGAGTVVGQSLNEIAFDGVSGAEAVLRFHWMETLRCRPECTVERAAQPGDRVGFIRVPSPPSHFEIFNAY